MVGAGTALLVESETIWALAKLAARASRTVFVKYILSIYDGLLSFQIGMIWGVYWDTSEEKTSKV